MSLDGNARTPHGQIIMRLRGHARPSSSAAMRADRTGRMDQSWQSVRGARTTGAGHRREQSRQLHTVAWLRRIRAEIAPLCSRVPGQAVVLWQGEARMVGPCQVCGYASGLTLWDLSLLDRPSSPEAFSLPQRPARRPRGRRSPSNQLLCGPLVSRCLVRKARSLRVVKVSGVLGAQDPPADGQQGSVLIASPGHVPVCQVKRARWARVVKVSGCSGPSTRS